MEGDVFIHKYLDLIERTPFLKSLSKDDLICFLDDRSFKTSSYSKNSIVHSEGDVCEKLEIVLSGKVVVERIDESGMLMTVAEFFDDDMIGGNLLFSKKPYYPMTVTAKHSSIILEISKDRLFKLFSINQDFLRCYLEFVSEHATILGDKIKHYVNRTIRESVLNFLNYESKKQNSNCVMLNMTKKELAEKIGVQRTSLSRELLKMKNEGLILFDAHCITVLR